MAYLEDLPEQCPPAAAQDTAFGPAYRILPDGTATLQHFYSYQKLGLPKPGGVDDCRYMSCSLFTCIDKAKAVASMPKKRATSTHLATLNVPIGSGVASINAGTKHVDFWPYDTFDVTVAVTGVVAL